MAQGIGNAKSSKRAQGIDIENQDVATGLKKGTRLALIGKIFITLFIVAAAIAAVVEAKRLIQKFRKHERGIKLQSVEVTSGHSMDKWFRPILCPEDWLNMTKVEEDGINKTILIYAITFIPHLDLYPVRRLVESMAEAEQSKISPSIFHHSDREKDFGDSGKVTFPGSTPEDLNSQLTAELKSKGLRSYLDLVYWYAKEKVFYAIDLIDTPHPIEKSSAGAEYESNDAKGKMLLMGGRVCYQALKASTHRFTSFSDRAFIFSHDQTINNGSFPRFYMGLSNLGPYAHPTSLLAVNMWNVKDMITSWNQMKKDALTESWFLYSVRIRSVDRLPMGEEACEMSRVEGYAYGGSVRLGICAAGCEYGQGMDDYLNGLEKGWASGEEFCPLSSQFLWNQANLSCQQPPSRLVKSAECTQNCFTLKPSCKSLSFKLKKNDVPQSPEVPIANSSRMLSFMFVLEDIEIMTQYEILEGMEFVGALGGIFSLFLGLSMVTLVQIAGYIIGFTLKKCRFVG